MVRLLPIVASLFGLSSLASALNSIVVKGQDFVDSVTNDRFVIIGIDYQPGGSAGYGTTDSDPLSNSTACLRDAALMQMLGINTIRVYNVNPALNHDQCASIFNAVGIYMLIDVNSPLAGQSIDRTDPSGSYTTSYLTHIFSNVEAFKSYPNLLGFFAGNEIINDVPSAKDNPPYIRAVQRDLKQYIKNHASRTIPVGYSAADVTTQLLQDTWEYFQCDDSSDGSNDESRSDFFGLNDYEWCGAGTTYESSGYATLVAMFSNTTIPVFFSEYGCNVPAPRLFNEVLALYGPQMTVLSGGLVYEWSQEGDEFGLVTINSNASVSIGGDYNTLQTQYNKLNVTLLQSGNATANSLTPPACSADLISDSGFSKEFTIPSTPSGGAALIASGVSNAPSGTIVAVTNTAVSVPVYKVNGQEISNLSIKKVTQANSPDGSDTDSSATGSASASATHTSTSKGAAAAARETGFSGGLLAAALGLGVAVL